MEAEVGLTWQMALDLRERTHGGARPGAGRPRKTPAVRTAEKAPPVHRARPSHRKGEPVHVTLRPVRKLPSLRRQVLARIVKEALLSQRAKLTAEAVERRGVGTHFQVVHFTIQDDHLHLIVEATDKKALARGLMGLEIRVARRINKALHRKGRFWAERYHRHDLRTPTETRNALRYVLQNLKKHFRGFGARDLADPCSSASTFDGFSRPPVVIDAQSWRHVPPRTWLLRIGWRCRGLLDPADTPSPSHERG